MQLLWCHNKDIEPSALSDNTLQVCVECIPMAPSLLSNTVYYWTHTARYEVKWLIFQAQLWIHSQLKGYRYITATVRIKHRIRCPFSRFLMLCCQIRSVKAIIILLIGLLLKNQFDLLDLYTMKNKWQPSHHVPFQYISENAADTKFPLYNHNNLRITHIYIFKIQFYMLFVIMGYGKRIDTVNL